MLAFGFAETEGFYTISYEILDSQFQMNVVVTDASMVSIRVLDANSRDEYVLVHTPNASGAFVGSVREACEKQVKG